MRLIPNSYGVIEANSVSTLLTPVPRRRRRRRVREFNKYHDRIGRFTTSAMSIGITSARPVGDPQHTSNRVVFQRMREYEVRLRALPGVSHVRVDPALGSWQGGWEPSWSVAYRGNGQAKRLTLQTAKRFGQDAVLLMHGCRKNCDPAVELTFDKPIGRRLMTDIDSGLGAAGLQGWTWMKQGGHTVLRAVAVPGWGGDRKLHVAALKKISTSLALLGLKHRYVEKQVLTEPVDKEHYDDD